MRAKSWQHVVTQAPMDATARMIPDVVAGDDATLELRHEVTAEPAYWGPGSRRYRAIWRSKGREAKAFVEIRPHSSATTEIVVCLDRPSGLVAALTWGARRLDRAAASFAANLRAQVEAQARRAEPARATRRARPA